jgi:hypothetical protein
MNFYHFAKTVRAFLGTFQAFLEPLMKLVEGYFCLMVFIVVYMKIAVLLSILLSGEHAPLNHALRFYSFIDSLFGFVRLA